MNEVDLDPLVGPIQKYQNIPFYQALSHQVVSSTRASLSPTMRIVVAAPAGRDWCLQT
jgi:hypothetical protein